MPNPALVIFMILIVIAIIVVPIVLLTRKDKKKSATSEAPPYDPEEETKPTVEQSPTFPLPEDYVVCSSEGQNCVIGSETQVVYYGADGKYYRKSANGTIKCDPNSFNGEDPAPGKQKSCYIDIPEEAVRSYRPNTFRPCASDTLTCNLGNNEQTVYYGSDVSNKYIVTQASGNFLCDISSFDNFDPSPKVIKTCYIDPTQGGKIIPIVNQVPSEYSNKCATDNETCVVTGEQNVYYGANGKYVNKKLSGSFTCAPKTFNIDPAPGTLKTCYTK